MGLNTPCCTHRTWRFRNPRAVFENRIDPAIQSNTIRHLQRSLPSSGGKALCCAENAEFAMSVLDILMTDKVRASDPTTSKMAECAKAVVLHQTDKTDAAIELLLSSLDEGALLRYSYAGNLRTWASGEIVPLAADRFVDLVEKKIKDGKHHHFLWSNDRVF